MRNTFKPLGIVAAVAAAAAGYSNVTSAAAHPAVAASALGDLALVPYYTVENNFITGVHVVNTSDWTQVVKFRLRRGTDSLDALDFNIVMSPEDVWAGFISQDESGAISFQADDTTCTAPAPTAAGFVMPEIYREGAETGYVEIIAMGRPDGETQPIAIAAKHKSGVPANCAAVRSNFFANGGVGVKNGVVDKETTVQTKGSGVEVNKYVKSGNVLKVSYFIRNAERGVEFGDNAVHIQNFLGEPAITNQELGYLSGDLRGFDFPDLNGGSPLDAGDRGKFNDLRNGNSLGVSALINEWSSNPANGVATDWVLTMPGQYTMLNMPLYLASLETGGAACTAALCDHRDLPVTATIAAYDREEGRPTTAAGELVVSPQLPGVNPSTSFSKEVNVVTFGGNGVNGVLGASDVDIDAGLDQPYGWLSLGVTSSAAKTQKVCEWDLGGETMTCTPVAKNDVPIIGFTAWERSFAANPDANYGRIIGHSFTSGS